MCSPFTPVFFPLASSNSCRKFSVARKTNQLKIPYYVKDNFHSEYQGSVGRLEASVEEDDAGNTGMTNCLFWAGGRGELHAQSSGARQGTKPRKKRGSVPEAGPEIRHAIEKGCFRSLSARGCSSNFIHCDRHRTGPSVRPCLIDSGHSRVAPTGTARNCRDASGSNACIETCVACAYGGALRCFSLSLPRRVSIDIIFCCFSGAGAWDMCAVEYVLQQGDRNRKWHLPFVLIVTWIEN